jgi:hypothetical protein
VILVHRHRFGVSRWHAREHPETATSAVARGPVLRLGLTFERWMGGRRLDADAFFDPGADETCLSARWVKEQGGRGKHAQPRVRIPDPELPGILDEGLVVEMAGCSLPFSAGRVRVTPQPPMAGFEDILLGRDFLAAHGLMFILDAEDEEFSILLPVDEDNRRRRSDILAALSPLDEHMRSTQRSP